MILGKCFRRKGVTLLTIICREMTRAVKLLALRDEDVQQQAREESQSATATGPTPSDSLGGGTVSCSPKCEPGTDAGALMIREKYGDEVSAPSAEYRAGDALAIEGYSAGNGIPAANGAAQAAAAGHSRGALLGPSANEAGFTAAGGSETASGNRSDKRVTFDVGVLAGDGRAAEYRAARARVLDKKTKKHLGVCEG
jgi:hypothetical protein